MINLRKDYPFKSRYINEDVTIIVSSYTNDTPAIVLLSTNGERLATASVALEEKPRPDACFIKDWSENEGIQLALEQLGLIGPPIAHYRTGFVVATEHMMKGDLLNAWKDYVDSRNVSAE